MEEAAEVINHLGPWHLGSVLQDYHSVDGGITDVIVGLLVLNQAMQRSGIAVVN